MVLAGALRLALAARHASKLTRARSITNSLDMKMLGLAAAGLAVDALWSRSNSPRGFVRALWSVGE